MTGPFFRIERVTRRFGGLLAVNDVSFELRRDEIVGLIGPNGAGKTTLLRLITRVLRPDSGRGIFNGEDITSLRGSEVGNRGIACTFQNTRPFRHLPIVANVMVPLLAPRAHARGDWVRKIDAKAMDALEFVGIADQALEPPSALSRGDLKRLEVARAIATEPELLLLDEPLGGLNPAESELLARSIKRLHKGRPLRRAAQGRPLRQAALRRAGGADDRAQAEGADVHRRPGHRHGPRRGVGRRNARRDREESEGGGSLPGVRECRRSLR